MCFSLPANSQKEFSMSAVAVSAMFRAHPEQPSHADAIGRCIDACSASVETSNACADACLAEKDMERLITCIRLNQDCAAVCSATASIMSRANKIGHRQLLEAQLTTCIAFCRATAAECGRHAQTHKHCEVCAKACTHCATACIEMLTSLRMPT
jgi:hypothetical protein